MSLEKRFHTQHAAEYDTDRRYDLLILAARDGYRLPAAMAHAMILNFATERWLRPVEEAICDSWTEVYCSPGVSAHNIFTRSAFDQEIAPFEEAAIYFGQDPVCLDYAGGLEAFFYIELRRCLFKDIHGDFRQRLSTAFNLRRARVLTRPAQPLPPHRVAETAGADETDETDEAP